MSKIPFVYDYEFLYGQLERLTPLIRRITAHNPGSFTFRGTGTYVIGHGQVAVVDPGPLDPAHIAALKLALAGETVSHILITHTHLDHSPAAAELKQYWHCKTYGYGPHGERKSTPDKPIEAGGDMQFIPDVAVSDGEVIRGEGWTIECVFTPGHTSNHMCFSLGEEKALFTGDHVMGWSTTVIGPPDGDMTEYMTSLDKLLERDEVIYWPTHGTCIRDVKHYVEAFILHRKAREQQILDCLSNGHTSIKSMIPIMYADTDKSLFPAAAQSVLAAMERLLDLGRVTCSEVEPGMNSDYTLNIPMKGK